MNNVKFEKLEEYKYALVNGGDQIDTMVLNIIDEISIVPNKLFNDTITEILYETILNRLISGLFLKDNLDSANTMHHVLITVGINNKTYNVTLGAFNKEEDLGYVTGITEI